jgi:predicted RNase H-like nuclease
VDVRLVSRLAEVLQWKPPPRILCVDMPIGLLDRAVPGGRTCDREARALLGRPRGSSVFTPPVRRALKARTFPEALRLNRGTRGPSPGPGIAIQTYAILPKLREVDELVTETLQNRVIESHPELCFYEMNGRRPVVEGKKTAEGRRRRIRLLETAWRRSLSDAIGSRPRGVARDDLLDAMALCWTAERVLRKRAIRLPARTERDARGLRMEIVR